MKQLRAILIVSLVLLLWKPFAQAAVASDPRPGVNLLAFEELLSDINSQYSAIRAATARSETTHGRALVDIDGANTVPYYPAPSSASAIVHEFIVALDPACASTAPSVPAQMRAILSSLAATVSYEYSAALSAYRVRYTPSASFPEFPHNMLTRVPCIRYIEQLQAMQITAAPQVEALPAANTVPGIANASVANLAGALWGLDRIDTPASPSPPALVDGRYSFDLTGRGVHIYVIDSGISSAHPEYAPSGRAELAYTVSFISPETRNAGPDCTGHGSNVAAIAAGLNVGVAKAAAVHAVRVLGCEETTNADVVEAIDWVVTHHQRPAVINLSLGPQPNENGRYSRVRSIDDSIARAIASGITVVVAAGNDQLDCCGGSPAGADGAIVVGASTLTADNKRDVRAPFSNFGSCVTLSAPGMDIISAAGANGAPAGTYAMLRGTSQAAPYVTGVVAQLLQAFPDLKPAEVAAALRKLAVPNVVGDARTSPARMLRSATVALAEQVLNRTAKFSAATAIQAISFPSNLSPATFDPSLGVLKKGIDNAANMVEYSGKATRSVVIAGVVGGAGAAALGAAAVLVYLRRRVPSSLAKDRRPLPRSSHQPEPPAASLWDDAGHEPVAPLMRRPDTSPPADLPSVPRTLGEQDTSSVVAELQGPSLFRLSRFAQVQPAHTKAGVSRGLRLSMGDSLVTETNRDSRFVSTPPRMSMRPTSMRQASMSRPVPPLPPSRVAIKYPTPVFPGQSGAIPTRILELQQAAAPPVPTSDLAIISPTSSSGFAPPFVARFGGAYPRDSEIATDVTTTSISRTPPPVSRTAPSLVPRPADTLPRSSTRLNAQGLVPARPGGVHSAPDPSSVAIPVLPAIPAANLADVDAFFDQVVADLALLDPETAPSSK
ncbi:hypothetical protein AMAG_01063 [Allomyces macrogynus ATCC 38327]|uniref:Peptidase S8/S53 domain-containing protein n=1 Tax=Allomyces macrogynus (strain ATCC 38327) TaxID=578462 RepID=A0A0L0RYH7_ALLM3|nr:hypothetical protein AMAG_01063 [Allomyces macrogynus ATCC 38327]|eukprot:KNE55139.1 hypothetical protein AMAG_01063 [Allomyces macrogynus ATCC 38327]